MKDVHWKYFGIIESSLTNAWVGSKHKSQAFNWYTLEERKADKGEKDERHTHFPLWRHCSSSSQGQQFSKCGSVFFCKKKLIKEILKRPQCNKWKVHYYPYKISVAWYNDELFSSLEFCKNLKEETSLLPIYLVNNSNALIHLVNSKTKFVRWNLHGSLILT